MKERLKKLLAQKNKRKAEIKTQAEASQDVVELRKLNTEMESINAEIREIQGMIDDWKEETPDPVPIVERTAAVNGEIPLIIESNAKGQERRDSKTEDMFDSLEYRKAFMGYCKSGDAIPTEFRSDAFTGIADAAAVIPTTIMNEIIKEMKEYGQIFNRVRKTNIAAGVQVPILSLKPVATRITESAPSERKKITANTYISFGYFGLECKIATSLLATIVTLPMFEAEIVPLITEAMVKKQEIEIFKGTGEGEMLGVMVDTRVGNEQKITLSSADMTDWGAWKKKVFAKMPLSYRAGGVFVMGAGTFDGYIDGMQDANGQPIGRTNYGITDSPQYRFGGKEIVEVEEDIIASYDNADVGDVIAVYMKLSDYVINSNMQMAMYRWLDHDTNQWVDKAILINDGKLLDVGGILIIKKGA